uniref:helix-turn-helix domain-containing protein n=1 Tax=Streptomyces longisporoflavus TaxID=28044 RepID=UPI001E2A077D|nr:helix-turn-helix domain-containing protein [Streptomyces longisporoflavus]
MRLAGASLRTIAERLGRNVSTISREISRNVSGPLNEYYPHRADSIAENRRCRPKPTKIAHNPQLRDAVQEGLDKRWSPEQIAGHLRAVSDQPGMTVAHETIYRSLYADGGGELLCKPRRTLRSGRDRRYRRITKPARRTGSPPPW